MTIHDGSETTDPSRPASVHVQLRDRTRTSHKAVDAAFGRFDLAQRADYIAFLSAHARILPELERQLEPATMLEGWHARAPALAEDLATLEAPFPPSASITLPPGPGARWGALYVVEGSRLGGLLLSRRVGAGLPTAYLSSAHEPGGWKSVLVRLEDAAEGPAWLDEAIAGARTIFATYQRAAEDERNHG